MDQDDKVFNYKNIKRVYANHVTVFVKVDVSNIDLQENKFNPDLCVVQNADVVAGLVKYTNFRAFNVVFLKSLLNGMEYSATHSPTEVIDINDENVADAIKEIEQINVIRKLSQDYA